MKIETKTEIINKEEKRIDYFDIAKGIGIILMILGHMSLQNKYVKNFLYTFHMPLFFIISGYFFKYRENKTCIKKIIKKLIVPYIITCITIIVYKVLRLILDGNFLEITNTIKTWGLASIYGNGYGIRYGIQFIGAIWFLLALGFAIYFMNLIYNQRYRYLWVLLIAYVGYKTSTYIWLPLSIQVGMVALVFVYIGVLVRKNELLNIKLPIILYIFFSFIVLFCTKYCGNIDMVRNYYNDGLIDLIGGLSGTFLCIKISILINKYTRMLRSVLVFIGRNSLLCMCIHLFSLDCLNWVTINKILENIGISRQDIRNMIINYSFVFLILIIIKLLQIIGLKLKKSKYDRLNDYRRELMKNNRIFNIISIIITSLLVILGAIGTSLYSKKYSQSEKSKFNFYFNMSKWNYDEDNNVYYQINVDYCEKSKINENEKFDIFVPGEYLIGKRNSNGTYKCEFNNKGEKAGYNVKSAPMVIHIEKDIGLEQETHKKYDYETISKYINEGYIYIWPGTRGLKENQKAELNEEYSNAIIQGVTDLKAVVRFCRFNKGIIPGNVEKIIAYGTDGGGTKSAILGSSGDSELYSAGLIKIGAIMVNDEGRGISDAVNGTMCFSPTNILEISENAYSWCIGQYLIKEKKSKEKALQYAEYTNNMKLKSEDGSLLYLNQTEQGIYTEGTYYSYMLKEIEKSVNLFIQNTTFPYTSLKNNITYHTALEYVESLNVNGKWINYDESINTAKVISFKDLSNFYKNNENILERRITLDEYNPYYYLSNKYKGIDSSYVCRNWNICTLLDDKNVNFLPEENLKLILQKNENVKKVNYSCIWVNEYTENEKNKVILDYMKNWIKTCF